MSAMGVKIDQFNHPVHIKNERGELSPSAFIPFCEFGGNISSMGVRIEEFDVPVCNSFQAKIMNDQLCYEVDLNRFSNMHNIDKELELGFIFLLDYNEDRQFSLDEESSTINKFGLASSLVKSDQRQKSFIYLDTIGKYFFDLILL